MGGTTTQRSLTVLATEEIAGRLRCRPHLRHDPPDADARRADLPLRRPARYSSTKQPSYGSNHSTRGPMGPRPLGSSSAQRQNARHRVIYRVMPRLNRPKQPHRLPFLAPWSRRPIDYPARCRRRDLPLRLACRTIPPNQHVTSTARRTIPRSAERVHRLTGGTVRHKYAVHNLAAEVASHSHKLPGFPVPSGHAGGILSGGPRTLLIPEGVHPHWRRPKGSALHVRLARRDRYGFHTNWRGRNPSAITVCPRS